MLEIASGLGVTASTSFLVVEDVVQGGLAQRAGLKDFDLLLMVDGSPVWTLKDFRKALRRHARKRDKQENGRSSGGSSSGGGDDEDDDESAPATTSSTVVKPRFTVRRLTVQFGAKSAFAKDGALVELTMKVDRKTPNGALGASLKPAFVRDSHVPLLLVSNVRPGMPMAEAGVQAEDQLTSVDGDAVNSQEEVLALLAGKTNFSLGVRRFGQASKTSRGVSAHNFWAVADRVFDEIDSAATGKRDAELSFEDLRAFLKKRASGDETEARELIEDMDGYSNTGQMARQDGLISRSEWYGFFDFLAEDDTGMAETSPAAHEALRRLADVLPEGKGKSGGSAAGGGGGGRGSRLEDAEAD